MNKAIDSTLAEVLYKIACLDPQVHSDEGCNEWGEADCFHIARRLAFAALNNSGLLDELRVKFKSNYIEM